MTAWVERQIARIAERQRGLVGRRQLLALGLGTEAIKYRLRTGRLFLVYPGVYAVGSRPSDPRAFALAAVMACGPDAALSHASAAFLWGLRERLDHPVEVTVPRNRAPRGVRVHRARTLLDRDFRTHLGIRVTSPARTVLDWAPRLTDAQLARAVNEARLDKYANLKLPELADILARFPRHPDATRLKWFVQRPTGGPTRSEFEDAFLAFTQRFGLPTPQTNVTLAGHLVDAFFPIQNLIVELDGYDFHQGRKSFETDRERDADTLAAGHPTVRVTWERMTDTPQREADRLQRILGGPS
jgi:hypothetical protein